MKNKISEIDGETKARRWLGGEAAVPAIRTGAKARLYLIDRS